MPTRAQSTLLRSRRIRTTSSRRLRTLRPSCGTSQRGRSSREFQRRFDPTRTDRVRYSEWKFAGESLQSQQVGNVFARADTIVTLSFSGVLNVLDPRSPTPSRHIYGRTFTEFPHIRITLMPVLQTRTQWEPSLDLQTPRRSSAETRPVAFDAGLSMVLASQSMDQGTLDSSSISWRRRRASSRRRGTMIPSSSFPRPLDSSESTDHSSL